MPIATNQYSLSAQKLHRKIEKTHIFTFIDLFICLFLDVCIVSYLHNTRVPSCTSCACCAYILYDPVRRNGKVNSNSNWISITPKIYSCQIWHLRVSRVFPAFAGARRGGNGKGWMEEGQGWPGSRECLLFGWGSALRDSLAFSCYRLPSHNSALTPINSRLKK